VVRTSATLDREPGEALVGRRRGLVLEADVAGVAGLFQGVQPPVERQTADLRSQIDRALELGYDVLLVRLGHVGQDQLERESGMIASRHQLAALRAVLQRDYIAQPAFTDPVMGPFDRLQRAKRE